jgi:hypothetical protein
LSGPRPSGAILPRRQLAWLSTRANIAAEKWRSAFRRRATRARSFGGLITANNNSTTMRFGWTRPPRRPARARRSKSRLKTTSLQWRGGCVLVHGGRRRAMGCANGRDPSHSTLHLAFRVLGDWGGRRSMGCANFQNLGRNGVQLGRLECHVAQISEIRMPRRAPAAPASNEQRKRGSNVGVMSALGALSLAALAPSPRRIGAAVRLVAADPPSHARLLAAVPPLTPLAARTALVRPHRGVNARKSTRRPRTTQSRLASLCQSCARLWV